MLLLLQDADLDTLPLGQRYERLGSLSDDEHILTSGGEGLANGILNVDDIVGARVLLTVLNDAHTTHVTSGSHHAQVADVVFNELEDFALKTDQVQLDSMYIIHQVHADHVQQSSEDCREICSSPFFRVSWIFCHHI